MMRDPRTRVTWLLATTLAGLSYGLSASTDPVGNSATQSPQAALSSVAIPLQQEPQFPDLSNLSETVRRPLFTATRRAPNIEEAPEETAPFEERSYELVGVTLFGKRRVALIRARGDSQLRRVSEGQRFDRWRVLRIEPKQILFAQGKEIRELRLKDDARSRPRPPREIRKAEAVPVPDPAAPGDEVE